MNVLKGFEYLNILVKSVVIVVKICILKGRIVCN